MCYGVLSGSAQNPYVDLISGTRIACRTRESLVLEGVSSCNGFAVKHFGGPP
jgi:hypothetical protein